MNIGVIGGSGFIGSHVVDKLIEAGHEVTVFDMMKPQRDDVRHIYIDITDLSKTTVALTGAYDAVYMLAAMADVNDVYKNPVEAGHVNILAVANALEAARRSEIGRVILASTVWVYSFWRIGYFEVLATLKPGFLQDWLHYALGNTGIDSRFQDYSAACLHILADNL